MPALDILCLGEPLAELNETEPGRFTLGCGGDVSNVAIAAARLGARSGVLGAIGDDAFGEALTALWDAEGVDRTYMSRDRDAPTGIYFVTHGPDGHRFSYRRAGSAASLVGPDRISAEAIAATRILHASGISQAISTTAADGVFAALAKARDAGVVVSYDTNLRLKLWPLARARATIREALTLTDLALPGLDDAALLFGVEDPDAICDAILALGPKVVALTLGAHGCLVATPERRERIAAHPVRAVDATGAGDAFDGAFLTSYLDGRDPFAAARRANVSAALSTRGYGAIPPLPRRAELDAEITREAASKLTAG